VPAAEGVGMEEVFEHPIDGTVSCGCCGRFPLVGERVTRHVNRRGREWACEPCEASGRCARLGAITDSDRVRSLGGAANVHVPSAA
jgi:hypothetical protein